MGQTTVLRFIEKPKKVVLGNTNYYTVEFIDNDLALKPLGAVTTNLFVYGVKNVYGFILRTNQTSNYDDIVQVDLKENKFNPKVIAAVIQSSFKETSRLKLLMQVGPELKVTLQRIQRFDGKDFYLLDFLVENTTKNEVDLSKIEIFLNRGKSKLSPQEFILQESRLKSGEITSGRVFVSIGKKTEVSLEIHYMGKSVRQTILGKFL